MELYRYYGIISFGIIVFVGIPAADWLGLVWGQDFVPGAHALWILTLCLPFVFLADIHILILYSNNKELLVLLFTAISVAIDIVLDIALIPVLGIDGAAWATLVTYVTFYFLSLFVFLGILGMQPLLAILAGPAISAGAAGGFMFACREMEFFARMPVGIVIFCSLLLVTRSIGRRDLETVRALLGRSDN